MTIKDTDYTDYKFGALTALYKSQRKHNSNYQYWTCRCDCGKLKDVLIYNLIKGHTQTCGCQSLRKEKTDDKLSVFKKVAADYKHKAKKRGIEWKLKKNDVFEIIDQPCFYCGIEPSNTCTVYNTGRIANHSGIDRMNNDVGYEKDNCVPCCAQCNYAKMGMSVEQFYNWIRAAYKHIESKYDSKQR